MEPITCIFSLHLSISLTIILFTPHVLISSLKTSIHFFKYLSFWINNHTSKKYEFSYVTAFEMHSVKVVLTGSFGGSNSLQNVFVLYYVVVK